MAPTRPRARATPAAAAPRREMGLDSVKPPMSQVHDMFQDLLKRLDLDALVGSGTPVFLNVATLCSGTDAPIFGLQQIQDAGRLLGLGDLVHFDHLYSCEIEPYKQAFLRRNMKTGTIIFRDVVEMANAVMAMRSPRAMTAGGFLQEIPTKQLDVLFCGCSCVDYSTLSKNGKKKAFQDLQAIEAKFREILEEGGADPEKMRNLAKGVGKDAVKAGLLNRIAEMDNGGGEPSVGGDGNTRGDGSAGGEVGAGGEDGEERENLDMYMNDGQDLDAEWPMEEIRLDQSFVNSIAIFIQKLQQGGMSGESCRTFFAALMLMVKHRPKTIILENVFGAPWRLYTHRIFPRIGYYATHVKVDSKDYYIPQTRQRGYLVAVDVTASGDDFSRHPHRALPGPGARVTRAMAEKIADGWVKFLLLAERRASSSAAAFLRSPEDPVTIQARADMEGSGSVAKGVDWVLSSIRHDRERETLIESKDRRYLRQQNPFSHKVVRHDKVVYAQFADFAWLKFWSKQVVRCVDLVDLRLAIALAEGNDIRFRPYLLDISQNVDRNRTDTKKGAGIIGCITPKGQPIVSDLMRPITGFEALALQGMPVDDLVISTESSAQLHNLAGNAMTVTVVGAATLALLLSVTSAAPFLFGRQHGPRPCLSSFLPKVADHDLIRGTEPRAGGLLAGGMPAAGGGLFGNLGQLCAIASGGRRVCFCQYSSPVPEALGDDHKWLSCSSCGHTACSICSGNPKHHYGPLPQLLHPRYSSAEARVELLKRLPMSFAMKAPPNTVGQLDQLLSYLVPEGPEPSERSSCYASVVRDILGTETDYYYDAIKITETVTVCYKAQHSVARLVLAGNSATMYIYLDPSHPKRQVLRDFWRGQVYFDLDYQPVARVVFPAEGSKNPEWSVWINTTTNLQIEAAMDADGTITTGDIEFADQPPQARHHDLLRWKALVDARVSNSVFESLRDCGTPFDELRVKMPPRTVTSGGNVFFMRHCDQAGTHEEDPWVWTTNVKKLESHEYREVLLQFRNPPRTEPKKATKGKAQAKRESDGETEQRAAGIFMEDGPSHETLDAFWTGYWARFGESNAPQLVETIRCTVDWVPKRALDAARCHSQGNDNTSVIPLAKILLTNLRNFPAPESKLHSIHQAQIDWQMHLAKIPITQRDSFLHLFAFGAASVQLDKVPTSTALSHLAGDWIDMDHCEGCCLETPKVHFFQGTVFELRADAFSYELAVKALPVPITIGARQDGAAVELVVHLSPKVLVSRALAYLSQAHPYARSGSQGLNARKVTKLRIQLNYSPPASAEFKPLAQNILRCSPAHNAGIDLASLTLPPAHQPPRFVLNNRVLWKGQLEATQWMYAREVAPAGYLESEMEEDVIRGLNLRVVGKVEWENKFPYSPRGGVVGHEIGYGKTVVMLGLIDHRSLFNRDRSIEERSEQMEPHWWNVGKPFASESTRPPKSFLHLKATLVIVPAHITGQWATEALKFLGLRLPQLLVITKLKDLKSKSQDVLEAAEVIILSKAAFQEPDFLKQLDLFSTTNRAAKLAKGRELEHLHETAMNASRKLMSQYLQHRASGRTETEANKLVNQYARGLLNDAESGREKLKSQLPTDSSRNRDSRPSKKAKANNGGAQGAESEDSTSDDDSGRRKKKPQSQVNIDWKCTGWIQNLSFARIVWDEFTYEDENLSVYFQTAMANAKYLLSATPKLANLGDVCDVAKKFRIHVARAEPQMMPGLPPVTAGPVQDQMTKCEEFRAFSSGVKSVDMAVHRHEQAERFLASWFRSNHLLDEGVEFDVEEAILASEMSPQNAARYHLAAQDVEDAFGVFERIPLHIRWETPIHKSDIRSKEGDELCMALLVHLASGVGRETESIDTFVNQVKRKVEVLERQWKALVDKLMWLWGFLSALTRDEGALAKQDKAYEQIKNTMESSWLKQWSSSSSSSSSPPGNDSYAQSGGPEMYARDRAILLGRPLQIRDERRLPPTPFTLPAALADDWPARYAIDMALYSWIDFWSLPVRGAGPNAKINPPLADNVVRKLLEDLATVLVKADAGIDPLAALASEHPLIDKTLDRATRDFRRIPPNIAARSSVTRAGIGRLDRQTTEQLVVAAAAHKPARPHLPRDEKRLDHGLGEGISVWGGLPPPEKKTLVTETRQTYGEVLRKEKALASARRDLRFVRRLAEVFSLGQAMDRLCDQCGREFVAPGMSFLVAACGHRLCHECKANLHQSCGVAHCGVFTLGRTVLRCAGAGIRSGGAVEWRNKASLVAELIGQIPDEDFIVVFAQYEAILDAIKLELERQGVSLTLLTSRVDQASAQLERFKAGNGGRVLLIDIGSDHSAGSNITVANHVIFAHPYISTDPKNHLRVMRQAAGRCVRQGQTKKVKLYHLMARNTIEEKVLRDRAAQDPAFAAVFERSHVPAPWWLDNETAVYRPRLVLRQHMPRPEPHADAGYRAGDEWKPSERGFVNEE